MFDLRNSVQEKGPGVNPLIHPRSAPIKPDPDASAGPKGFGTNIYSMFQGDDASKQKKIQQKTYFQELTRQINEKKDQKTVDVSQSINFSQDKPMSTLSNFSNDMQKLVLEEEKKYPRWQKKYEIENHIGINVNTSQVFGGVLQRDEAQLLKQKKEEQQKEMQLYLLRQIEEKNRKRLEEQASRRKAEEEELERHQFEEVPIPTAKKEEFIFQAKKEEVSRMEENIFQPKITESPNSKTLTAFKPEEENTEMKVLAEAVQKLIQEKEDLRMKITEQEKQIKDLHTRPALKPERESKSELDKRRPPKARVNSAQEAKMKIQHDQERAKLAIIEEKLENARKKRMEQAKLKNNSKPRRISEAKQRVESRENLNKPSRIKTAVFPVQKHQNLLADSPRVPVKPLHFDESELKEVDYERGNLDTAGKSKFIYPDAEGNFTLQDEIDKFVTSYEKRESPLVNYKSPYRNSPVIESDKFNFTTNSLGPRRDVKPLVANKAGFPSDIFRLP